jgi:hypothetical protein
MKRQPLSLHAEQDAIFDRAQAAADAIERIVQQIWNDLLTAIRLKGNWWEVFHEARKAVAQLQRIPDVLAVEFVNVAKYSRQQTQAKLTRKLRERSPHLMEADEPIQLTYQELAARHGIPIFGPAPLENTLRTIYASDWRDRLQTLTKLASPDALAARIANGVQLGQTPAEIARSIAPLVMNVRSSAKRVARTEGMRIAHAEQMAAYDEVGELIIGFEVRSMRVHSTRPWHAARHGKQYFKQPAAGQKGMAQCPHPPEEPDDPAERPAGTPKIAPNCLCWLEPILRPTIK